MRTRIGSVLVLIVTLTTFTQARGEYRTWTATNGGFTTLAEFVALKPGNVVALQIKDGGTRDVSLDKLCAADQAYVRQAMGLPTAPPAVSTVSNSAPPASAAAASTGQKAPEEADRALKAVEREAQRSKTAEEAVLLYDAFLTDSTLPPATRSAAVQKQTEWKQAVEKGLVRSGLKWVTVDEVRNNRIKAFYLINQGLELVRLSQDQMGLEKLLEASRTDPDAINADFIIATVYAIVAHNFDKAQKHYEVCLKRDPGNPSVLNNLALTEIKVNQHSEAVLHFKQAAAAVQDPRIAQNLGRLFDQAGKRKINVPKSVLSQLSDVYATLVLKNNVSGAIPNLGWQYMLIPQEPPPDESAPTTPSDGTVDSGTAACGSGIVVAPKYVLTTRRGTKGADGFMIVDPSDREKTLPAKLVSSSKDSDLALLECPDLAAPAMAIDWSYPRLESSITVAGYPEADMNASALKVARGRVIALATAKQYGWTAYECGNLPTMPGGPVVDSMGNLIAMHLRTLSVSVNRYGAGVPMFTASFFLRKSLTEFNPQTLQADLPESEINGRIAKSTVVVLAKIPAQDVGLARRVGEGYLIDKSCCQCNGTKTVECPMRNCNKGSISVTRQVQTRDPASGRAMVEEDRVNVKCDHCNGSGRVQCPSCHGSGTDPDVRAYASGGTTSTRGSPLGSGS